MYGSIANTHGLSLRKIAQERMHTLCHALYLPQRTYTQIVIYGRDQFFVLLFTLASRSRADSAEAVCVKSHEIEFAVKLVSNGSRYGEYYEALCSFSPNRMCRLRLRSLRVVRPDCKPNMYQMSRRMRYLQTNVRVGTSRFFGKRECAVHIYHVEQNKAQHRCWLLLSYVS